MYGVLCRKDRDQLRPVSASRFEIGNSGSSRDVNEDDTVTIIVDILSGILGYDKFLEVTKEFQIRSTYCDLATLINGKISLLIEVKTIGIELKRAHVKQAVDYASNEGVKYSDDICELSSGKRKS